jgi:hypothetical protein
VRLVVSRPPGRSLLRIRVFLQVLSASRGLFSSGSNTHGVRLSLPSTRKRAARWGGRAFSAFASPSLALSVSGGDHLPELFSRRSCSTELRALERTLAMLSHRSPGR